MSTDAAGSAGAPQQTPDVAATLVVARSGRAAWIVIGIAMLVGAVLGTFVYFSAANGSVEIAHDLKDMRAKGATLTAEQCVEESLAWFEKRCDAVGRMCLDAVPLAVGECLAAQDRTEACVANGNDMKPSQWAYEHCAEMGIDKKSKKRAKESCTAAWRAFDSWCKSGQKGVAL